MKLKTEEKIIFQVKCAESKYSQFADLEFGLVYIITK